MYSDKKKKLNSKGHRYSPGTKKSILEDIKNEEALYFKLNFAIEEFVEKIQAQSLVRLAESLSKKEKSF